jgi:hypothetical protein
LNPKKIINICPNGNKFTSWFFDIYIFRSNQNFKHEMKHIINYPMHINLFHKILKRDPLPSLNNMKVKINAWSLSMGVISSTFINKKLVSLTTLWINYNNTSTQRIILMFPGGVLDLKHGEQILQALKIYHRLTFEQQMRDNSKLDKLKFFSLSWGTFATTFKIEGWSLTM